MAKKKLFPGVGAKGSILPKFIQPKGAVETQGNERCAVVLTGKSYTTKGSLLVTFKLATGDSPDLSAYARYVSIDEEGEIEQFFFDDDKEKRRMQIAASKVFKEPAIKWQSSKAKDLLYRDMTNGKVALEGNVTKEFVNQVYEMRDEYKEYDIKKLAGRIKGLRKTYFENVGRAKLDLEAFNNFAERNEPSEFSHKGYIQWQGSAQALLKQDLEEGNHNRMSKMDLWSSRVEYYQDFPLGAFRDKVYQEIRTGKYLHTLEKKGKQHKSS
jgi:hypothetical protein